MQKFFDDGVVGVDFQDFLIGTRHGFHLICLSVENTGHICRVGVFCGNYDGGVGGQSLRYFDLFKNGLSKFHPPLSQG